MTDNQTALIAQMEEYTLNAGKFDGGNKSAGTRARKALSEIAKLTKELRKEIQEAKNAL